MSEFDNLIVCDHKRGRNELGMVKIIRNNLYLLLGSHFQPIRINYTSLEESSKYAFDKVSTKEIISFARDVYQEKDAPLVVYRCKEASRVYVYYLLNGTCNDSRRIISKLYNFAPIVYKGNYEITHFNVTF